MVLSKDYRDRIEITEIEKRRLYRGRKIKNKV